MKLQLRNMDKNTWITAAGKHVKVYEMDVSYLENTINYLRRNESRIRLSILLTMNEFLQNDPPDRAAMACELEMDAITKMATDEFLIIAVPPYEKMLERHEKEVEKLK